METVTATGGTVECWLHGPDELIPPGGTRALGEGGDRRCRRSLRSRCAAEDTVIDIHDLSVHFDLGGSTFARLFGRSTGTVKAVDGVNLKLQKGEVIGLVGESGSGKSTLGRSLLGLTPITTGSVRIRDDEIDEDISMLSRRRLRGLRRHVQMVFQDPNAALNPAMTVEQALRDPLRIHKVPKAKRQDMVIDALERVGLSPVELFLTKYPRDLSGGQKQRVVIARAIIMNPSILVADEPISMLDMSVRAKILQLMLDLKAQLDLSYVYITHDLASAKFFCDRIAIMYLGRIVELGDTEQIFRDPKHPYTKALLAAIPDPDPSRAKTADLLKGEIPDAAWPPQRLLVPPALPGGASTSAGGRPATWSRRSRATGCAPARRRTTWSAAGSPTWTSSPSRRAARPR